MATLIFNYPTDGPSGLTRYMSDASGVGSLCVQGTLAGATFVIEYKPTEDADWTVLGNSDGDLEIGALGIYEIPKMFTCYFRMTIRTMPTGSASFKVYYTVSGGGINGFTGGTGTSSITFATTEEIEAGTVASKAMDPASNGQATYTLGQTIAEIDGANTNLIKNVGDPVSSGDAANKSYVDTLATVSGFFKQVVASTGGPFLLYSWGNLKLYVEYGLGIYVQNDDTTGMYLQFSARLLKINPNTGETLVFPINTFTVPQLISPEGGKFTLTQLGGQMTSFPDSQEVFIIDSFAAYDSTASKHLTLMWLRAQMSPNSSSAYDLIVEGGANII